MKIGLLVIATNKYVKFVTPLYTSVMANFMPGHEVTMFVFTNQPTVPEGVVRIEQEHISWPGPTLMRYHFFLKNQELLKQMDYLYYSDADMLFVDKVGDEVLGDLVATLHPGFYNKTKAQFTYERNPASAAFMPPNNGFSYFAGGFNGGKTVNFLKMAEAIRDMVDVDAKNGLIALWHDESYMNKYMSQTIPTNILPPSYCYPESWNIPFKKKLLALDKNHHDMRF